MTNTSNMSRRHLFRMAGMGGAAALLHPLLRAAEPKITTPPYNTLSREEELALGRKFSIEYEKEVEILRNPVIDAYLNGIVKKLGDNSQAPYWPYQVKVVNTSDINASAIPGGFLYLRRGLLEFVEDENEMVGALAHEVGHVVARHTTNQLALTFIAKNLYETIKKNLLMDNNVFTRVIEELGGAVFLIAKLKYSREQESEADLLGFYEMMRAGWHPNGLFKFFTRLQRVEPQKSQVDIMMSNHPASADRAHRMQKELDEVKINVPMREQTVQFKALKAALRILPPAPKPKEG
jgi:beta-barrel assembly-enhancing protease